MLVSMLKGSKEHEDEKVAAAKALYMLSFDEINKEVIRSNSDTMSSLQSLQNSDNKEILQAVSGIMWEIHGKIGHSENSGTCSVPSRPWPWPWKCDSYGLGIKLNLKSPNRPRFFTVTTLFVV